MKNFNFEAYTPPTITESDLKRLSSERNLKKSVTIVFVGNILTFIAALIFSAIAIKFFPPIGMIPLLIPAYSLLGGAVILFVFVMSNRRSTKHNRSNQKEV